MVVLHKSEVTRLNHKITVYQTEQDVLLTNGEDKIVISKFLLPDLSGLLSYISGYYDFSN